MCGVEAAQPYVVALLPLCLLNSPHTHSNAGGITSSLLLRVGQLFQPTPLLQSKLDLLLFGLRSFGIPSQAV